MANQQMIEKEWHIGCSGFHYAEWKPSFYPQELPQRKWFDYYTTHFNTIELNTTFYRFPQLAFLQNWYDKSPPSFRFSVKVPRAITHFKQFNQTDKMLGDFYNTTRAALAEKLGCILFQLPSRLGYTKERLARILASVDPSFTNVLEFRHPDWWQQEVYETLALHGISFCSMSHPGLPAEVIANTALVYYRFHGLPILYQSQYPQKRVQEVIDQVKDKKSVDQVYLYFNNTMGMGGIRNAKQAERYLKKTRG